MSSPFRQKLLIQEALEILRTGSHLDSRKEAKEILRKLRRPDGEQKGLRGDVLITCPFSERCMLVDATIVSSTVKSNSKAELLCTERRLGVMQEALAEGKDKPLHCVPGKTVEQAHTDKITLYAPLLAVMLKQQAEGSRQTLPEIMPAAMSTLGEIGKGTLAVQEFILSIYKKSLDAAGPRDDGYSANQLTANFRANFRMGALASVAVGQTEMFAHAGLPRGRHYVQKRGVLQAPARARVSACEENECAKKSASELARLAESEMKELVRSEKSNKKEGGGEGLSEEGGEGKARVLEKRSLLSPLAKRFRPRS